jgi:hypothetical protein
MPEAHLHRVGLPRPWLLGRRASFENVEAKVCSVACFRAYGLRAASRCMLGIVALPCRVR